MWRAKAAQMMNRPSEEEQLALVIKNLLPIYHKYLFAQYFPNFKALIDVGTQIEDAINNGTIKNDDPLRFKRMSDLILRQQKFLIYIKMILAN